MRLFYAILAGAILVVPAVAEEFPQGPKAGPPSPLPHLMCDSLKAKDKTWLRGIWRTPAGVWRFGEGTWALERRTGYDLGFDWPGQSKITGTITALDGCSVTLTADEGAFVFEGVHASPDGIFGVATARTGKTLRLTFRREWL